MTTDATHETLDDATQRDVARVFALQRAYRWTAKATTSDHRKAMLVRLKDAILRHAGDVKDALHADLGRPPEDPIMLEAGIVLGDIDEALENLDGWMEPVAVDPSSPWVAPGSRAAVHYEGRGVCLLFGPWNFPFQLTLTPLVPIIAAGNTAIVKPNEMAPACSALIAAIIRECFDEHEVAVFEGDVALADALLELPVDHIFLTGSPRVGSLVMAAAAKHLASVTLELGGKCPAIIDDTVDLAEAAAQVAYGKLYNAGQICLSPDHVWVKGSLRDEFVEHYLAWVKRNLYTDAGELDRAATARLIDARNFKRVRHYIDDARSRGAEVRGGDAHPDELVIEPAVLLDVPLDADVMRDEIFGPVLPVLTYEDVDEVIDHVRAGGKPLAVYVLSHDDDLVAKVLERTSSGGLTVNGWATHYAEKALPFGGVGASGYGRYHGHHGFKELSHERSVLRQPVLFPPY